MLSTRLANLAMLASKEVMFSCVKGVSAQVEEDSAHSMLLVHTNSRSSIYKRGNSCFKTIIMLTCNGIQILQGAEGWVGWGRVGVGRGGVEGC